MTRRGQDPALQRPYSSEPSTIGCEDREASQWFPKFADSPPDGSAGQLDYEPSAGFHATILRRGREQGRRVGVSSGQPAAGGAPGTFIRILPAQAGPRHRAAGPSGATAAPPGTQEAARHRLTPSRVSMSSSRACIIASEIARRRFVQNRPVLPDVRHFAGSPSSSFCPGSFGVPSPFTYM